jgi:isocitrate dehydrogenase (NAD+)
MRVLDAAGADLEYEVHIAGAEAVKQGGNPLPEDVLESVTRNKVALKGPVATQVGGGFQSINVQLRQKLELYANLRPSRSLQSIPSRFENVDIVVVRENTEDLYSGLEHVVVPGVVESIKIITEKASTRIAQFAFEYARRHNRKRVTAVHKANIMKFTDGLFLRVAREVAEEQTDIEFEDRIVDNLSMQLVQRPEEYDVLVCPNLYGDIVSDLCAGLIGGLGLAPGGNFGTHAAVFEPTHGSAPKYAGQNKVNPMAMLLSGVMMLRHLDEREAADRVEAAIAAVIAEGRNVTYDMKPTRDDPTAVGTSEVADAIIDRMGVRV